MRLFYLIAWPVYVICRIVSIDAWLENHEFGPAKWCAIKRNIKPQAPVIEAMKKAGVWDERMDALS